MTSYHTTMVSKYNEAAAATATAALAASNAATFAATTAAYISNALACITNAAYGPIDPVSRDSMIASCIAGASTAAAEAAAAAANAQAASGIATEAAAAAHVEMPPTRETTEYTMTGMKPGKMKIGITCTTTTSNNASRLEAKAREKKPPKPLWTVADAFRHANLQGRIPRPHPKGLIPGLVIKHDKERHIHTAYGVHKETIPFKMLVTVRGMKTSPASRFSRVPEKFLRKLAKLNYQRVPKAGDTFLGLLEVDQPGDEMKYGMGEVIKVELDTAVNLVTNGAEDFGVHVYD